MKAHRIGASESAMAEPRNPLIPLTAYKEAAARIPGLDAIALYNNNFVAQFARDYVSAQDKELSRYELGTGRHIALGIISLEGERGISPAELADRLGITRGAMTGLIDGLEKADLVRRDVHPGDRRMVKLFLTEVGAAKIAEYWPPHALTLCRFINTLTKTEQKQLVQLLAKLASGFKHLTG
jgi:DNA-binding MarR family transcriptional regulator